MRGLASSCACKHVLLWHLANAEPACLPLHSLFALLPWRPASSIKAQVRAALSRLSLVDVYAIPASIVVHSCVQLDPFRASHCVPSPCSIYTPYTAPQFSGPHPPAYSLPPLSPTSTNHAPSTTHGLYSTNYTRFATMKFLTLLSAVLVSLAVVSADSPVTVGAQKGKVPQLLDLINKFEHANPTDPTFLAQYATEIPQLAQLHREVAAQAGEKQVRRLYGDDAAAKKLLELVQGVTTSEKREVKPKKETKEKKEKDTKGKGKSTIAHKESKKEEEAKKEKSHPKHSDDTTERAEESKQKKADHKKEEAKKTHPAHKTHSTKPDSKEHKKPAHKHKTKSAKVTTASA